MGVKIHQKSILGGVLVQRCPPKGPQGPPRSSVDFPWVPKGLLALLGSPMGLQGPPRGGGLPAGSSDKGQDLCSSDPDDSTLDTNTKRMCNLHAHLMLMYRNVAPDELSGREARTLVTAMVFLQTRHQWNTNLIQNQPDMYTFAISSLS